MPSSFPSGEGFLVKPANPWAAMMNDRDADNTRARNVGSEIQMTEVNFMEKCSSLRTGPRLWAGICAAVAVLAVVVESLTPPRALAQAAGKVTDMQLTASPTKYTGPCPGRITFTGSVTTDGPAKVPYQYHSWLKSPDGKYKSWPGDVLTFSEAGTQSISKTIVFADDGAKFSTLMDIGTALPNPMHSKLVRFAVECGGATGGKATAAGVGAAHPMPAAGPSATQARVEVKSKGTVIPLKRQEQIAFMFVQAVASMEDDCGRHADEPCTLDALIRGPKSKDGWPLGKLKFDPNAADPNYSYKVAVQGDRWQVWANPRKPGLGGFYNKGSFGGTWYNAAGPATEKDRKIDEYTIEGDSFKGR